MLCSQPPDQPLEQQLGDFRDLFLGQCAEDDDLVDPVNELRSEAVTQDFQQVSFNCSNDSF